MERRREREKSGVEHRTKRGLGRRLNSTHSWVKRKKRKEKALADPGRERLFQWLLCDFPRDEQDSRSRRYASPQLSVLTGPRHGGEDWGTPTGPC